MCFIQLLDRPRHTDSDHGLLRLPDQDLGLTAGVTGRQEMLTPPRHWIPPLVYPGVRVRPISQICILFNSIYEIDHCSLFLPFMNSWGLKKDAVFPVTQQTLFLSPQPYFFFFLARKKKFWNFGFFLTSILSLWSVIISDVDRHGHCQRQFDFCCQICKMQTHGH